MSGVDPRDVVVPPLRGESPEWRQQSISALASAVSAMRVERDEAVTDRIAAHRALVAVLAAQGGEVEIPRTVLETLDLSSQIRTEYDARDGRVRVWLDPKPQDSRNGGTS